MSKIIETFKIPESAHKQWGSLTEKLTNMLNGISEGTSEFFYKNRNRLMMMIKVGGIFLCLITRFAITPADVFPQSYNSNCITPREHYQTPVPCIEDEDKQPDNEVQTPSLTQSLPNNVSSVCYH